MPNYVDKLLSRRVSWLWSSYYVRWRLWSHITASLYNWHSRFGLAVTRWSRSTYRRHPILLSMSHPSVDKQNEYPAKYGELTGTLRDSPYPWSYSVGLESGWRTSLMEISADLICTESGSALQACSRWCTVQINIYFTLLTFIFRKWLERVSWLTQRNR